MKINKKILTIAAIVTIAIAGILIIRKYNKKKETAEAGSNVNTNTGSSSSSSSGSGSGISTDNSDFPLRLGSRGKNVLALQKALNKTYNAGLSEDGIFGIKTERACVKYLGVKIINLPNQFA